MSSRAAFQAEFTRRALIPILLIASHFPARAQDPETDETIRIRTDLVTIPVVVTDGRGRRVTGLTREDFVINEDGRAVSVDYFAAGAERVAFVFALDASGSVRDSITHQREAALALFSRFGRNSRVAVLQFRERPELITTFTTDAAQVRSGFLFPALPDRRTAIFDAALAAVRLFAANGDPKERRIVILISDGLDNASRSTARDVIAEAIARQVSIYIIHLPLYTPRDGRLAPRAPSKGFRQIAEQTGGQYFMVGDAQTALDPHAELDLAPVFRAIADDLQSQYMLGYYAAEQNADGSFHRIEVRLRRSKRWRVHALRTGYMKHGSK